jgi:hypothetical protein
MVEIISEKRWGKLMREDFIELVRTLTSEACEYRSDNLEKGFLDERKALSRARKDLLEQVKDMEDGDYVIRVFPHIELDRILGGAVQLVGELYKRKS